VKNKDGHHLWDNF